MWLLIIVSRVVARQVLGLLWLGWSEIRCSLLLSFGLAGGAAINECLVVELGCLHSRIVGLRREVAHLLLLYNWDYLGPLCLGLIALVASLPS